MTEHITGQQLIAEVKRVAAAYPNRTNFEGICQYIHDGEPCCLIGHGLYNLGVIDSSFENDSRNDESFDFVGGTLDDLDITVDEIHYLHEVQRRADKNWPWGNTVERVPFLEPAS